jgi:hypothetical protein
LLRLLLVDVVPEIVGLVAGAEEFDEAILSLLLLLSESIDEPPIKIEVKTHTPKDTKKSLPKVFCAFLYFEKVFITSVFLSPFTNQNER